MVEAPSPCSMHCKTFIHLSQFIIILPTRLQSCLSKSSEPGPCIYCLFNPVENPLLQHWVQFLHRMESVKHMCWPGYENFDTWLDSFIGNILVVRGQSCRYILILVFPSHAFQWCTRLHFAEISWDPTATSYHVFYAKQTTFATFFLFITFNIFLANIYSLEGTRNKWTHIKGVVQV